MDLTRQTLTAASPIQWAGYAGIYMFVCAAVTTAVLNDVLVLLGDIIGVPAPYSLVVFASPTLVIGALTWWGLVERRDSYTYLATTGFGLVTALLTGLVWTGPLAILWGVEMLVVPIIAVLVGFVFGVAVVAGAVVALPLMYVRRQNLPGGGGD